MEDRDLASESQSKFHKSYRARSHRSYKTPRFLAVVEEMQRRRTLHEKPTGATGLSSTQIKEGTLTVHARSNRRMSGHSQASFQSGKNS